MTKPSRAEFKKFLQDQQQRGVKLPGASPGHD
jgi:hypothetical protein